MGPAAQTRIRKSREPAYSQMYYNNNGPYMSLDQAYPEPGTRELGPDLCQAHVRELEQERTHAKNRALDAELQVARLESRLRQVEAEANPTKTESEPKSLEPASTEAVKICQLCMDREINAAFTCGHMCCYECGLQTLEAINTCAFCKQSVAVIRLYS